MSERRQVQIIGLVGQKRSGKDSVAGFLAPYGFRRLALAEPIKRIAMDLFGFTREQVEGIDYDREQILPEWDVSVRQILQRIGSELGRQIHPDLWIRKLMMQVDLWDEDRFVIPDVRHLNEVREIRARGGQIWKIERPSFVNDDTHSSETEIASIEPDLVIVNDGTLEDLRIEVKKCLGEKT